MDVFDSIWEGKFYPDPSHFEELQSLYLEKLVGKSNGKLLINKSIIDKCTNEQELVLALKSHFKWRPTPKAILNRFDKSSKLSTILRERANESYKTGNVSRALRGYNLAVAFALVGSPELGLAFGNRSALLFHMKEFSLAIQDIDLALRNNFPENLKDKLVLRKEKCQTLLKNEKKLQDLSRVDAVKEFCEDNFFRIKNPNKNIPNAEDWVKVDFQEDRGRRLVATKDVPAGTLILIDKPFVSMINNLLTWDLQHCHFCSKSLLGGIPCELCTFTLYCNEDCRNKSYSGNHQYEHNYLPYLHSISLSSHKEIQALRLMGIVGPEKLFGFFKHPELLSLPSTGIGGFDETSQIYDSNSYLPIYHLISHGMSTTPLEKISDTFKAIYFTNILKENSNFFQKISKNTNSSEEIESFETFITSLIYRHMSNLRYNAISISKLKNSASGEISLSYATAMYPLVSLCNHSCDPNAVPVKKFEFLETSLITLKSLKAGEEIFITYRPLFPQMKTKERQAYLKDSYNFVCQCNACVNDWSLKSIKPTDKIHEVPQTCAKCLKKNGNLLKPCEECVKDQLVKMAVLDGFESQLYEVDDALKKGEFIKAVNILKVCLDYFTRNHSSCYSLSQVASELFKRALVRVMNQWQFNR